MSGGATFSGTNYQARVIAFINVMVLGGQRLGWLNPTPDRPTATSGETGGPGDDVRIELAGVPHSACEIQAKHGLAAGPKLREAITDIHQRSTEDTQSPVFLVTNKFSATLATIARELDRMREGRDDLHEAVIGLRDSLGAASAVLTRLRLIELNLDHAHDAQRRRAVDLLQSLLQDAGQAEAAWQVLVADAAAMCSQRGRRTRSSLVEMLKGAGVAVAPPTIDRQFHQELDTTRDLLNAGHIASGLDALAVIEDKLKSVEVQGAVRYRLFVQRAGALLQMAQYADAVVAARRALESDEQGWQALEVGARASLELGDVETARGFVRRAQQHSPGEPAVWAVTARLADVTGESWIAPASVRDSAQLLVEQADIAAGHDNWDGALALTGRLMSEGRRPAEVLLIHGNALLRKAATSSGQSTRDLLANAERVATELIEMLGDHDRQAARAYQLRATARGMLDRPEDSALDAARAARLAPDDPESLGTAAAAQLHAGHARAALATLAHPAVEEHPGLLVLRAEAWLALGDRERAHDDLANGVSTAADAATPNTVRLKAAEVALGLEDLDIAESMLAGVAPDTVDPAWLLVIRARVLFARGRADEATALFRAAMIASPDERAGLTAELAARLLDAGEASRALGVFREVPVEQLPGGAVRSMVTASLKAKDLVGAGALLAHLAQSGPLPEWALDAATTLALVQEDPEAAVLHLERFVEQREATNMARLMLVRCLIEIDRRSEAEQRLNAVLVAQALSPVEQMMVAELLIVMNRAVEAVTLAHRAYRQGGSDPKVARALVLVALRANLDPATVTEVGPDTSFEMRHDERTTSKTVLMHGPTDPRLGELTLDQAHAAGFMGRRLGDMVAFQGSEWTVTEIVPAWVGAVRSATANYESWFPGEEFFARAIPLSPEDSVGFLEPLIASVGARQRRTELVFQLYHEKTLPLGTVVSLAGGTIAEAMRFICHAQPGTRLLQVEWSDRARQVESTSAAAAATKVVLTRSALETMTLLGIRDVVAGAFELLAPRSLAEELRAELHEAEVRARRGHSILTSNEAGPRLLQFPAGDGRLVADRVVAEDLLAWFNANVRALPRPLDTIPEGGTADDRERELLGRSSTDALRLARQRPASLYADDLGLRRFLPKGSPTRSFSTLGLLPALAARGLLTAAERDHNLRRLARHAYVTMHPTPALLLSALNDADDEQERAAVLASIGAGEITLPEAARLAARLLKDVALTPIQRVPVPTLASRLLGVLSQRWNPHLCREVLGRACSLELRLLPSDLDAVLAVLRQQE